MSRWMIEKDGTGIEKSGTGIEKSGTGIEKSGTGIEKSGTGVRRACSGIGARQVLSPLLRLGRGGQQPTQTIRGRCGGSTSARPRELPSFVGTCVRSRDRRETGGREGSGQSDDRDQPIRRCRIPRTRLRSVQSGRTGASDRFTDHCVATRTARALALRYSKRSLLFALPIGLVRSGDRVGRGVREAHRFSSSPPRPCSSERPTRSRRSSQSTCTGHSGVEAQLQPSKAPHLLRQ